HMGVVAKYVFAEIQQSQRETGGTIPKYDTLHAKLKDNSDKIFPPKPRPNPVAKRQADQGLVMDKFKGLPHSRPLTVQTGKHTHDRAQKRSQEGARKKGVYRLAKNLDMDSPARTAIPILAERLGNG